MILNALHTVLLEVTVIAYCFCQILYFVPIKLILFMYLCVFICLKCAITYYQDLFTVLLIFVFSMKYILFKHYFYVFFVVFLSGKLI